MGRKRSRLPGLILRGRIWHIDKVVDGHRIARSCGTGDKKEAERYLIRILDQHREAAIYGNRPIRSFRDAAIKYLDETNKRSKDRDAISIRLLDPWIGELALNRVHMGTLQPFVNARRKQGVASGTVSRDLSVVIMVLTLAARVWRDEYDLPWLGVVPKLRKPDWEDKRSPRPLSWKEQVLFKINTGTREKEVCSLRWEWEFPLPELDTSIFVVPKRVVKNKEDRLVVMNRIAGSVIDELRGMHPDYVFTYRGERINKINQSGWRRARRASGLDGLRVHDLKHTFGRRLRAAGVKEETRKALLGHSSGDVTVHYSAPEIAELISAAETICVDSSRKTPALTVLQVRDL